MACNRWASWIPLRSSSKPSPLSWPKKISSEPPKLGREKTAAFHAASPHVAARPRAKRAAYSGPRGRRANLQPRSTWRRATTPVSETCALPWFMAASATGHRKCSSRKAPTCLSPHRGACSTSSKRAPFRCAPSNIWCSTRPTACSTWASCPMCGVSLSNARKSARRSSFPRRCRRRLPSSSNGRSVHPSASRSARGVRPPRRSRMPFIPWRPRKSLTFCWRFSSAPIITRC